MYFSFVTIFKVVEWNVVCNMSAPGNGGLGKNIIFPCSNKQTNRCKNLVFRKPDTFVLCHACAQQKRKRKLKNLYSTDAAQNGDTAAEGGNSFPSDL